MARKKSARNRRFPPSVASGSGVAPFTAVAPKITRPFSCGPPTGRRPARSSSPRSTGPPCARSAPLGGRAYLYAGRPPPSMYVTDGSTRTEVPLASEAMAGVPGNSVLRAVALGSRLIYRTTTSAAGPEPWVLDDPVALAGPLDGGTPESGAPDSGVGPPPTGVGSRLSSRAGLRSIVEPGNVNIGRPCRRGTGVPAAGAPAAMGVTATATATGSNASLDMHPVGLAATGYRAFSASWSLRVVRMVSTAFRSIERSVRSRSTWARSRMGPSGMD